jgi:hypothetical protein
VQTYFTAWVIELKKAVYILTAGYIKTIYLPNSGARAGKTMAKNSFRNRNFRQIKWRIVIKTMCILWGGIN